MDPLKIYDYLVKARQKVFEAVGSLSPSQYERPFAIGLNTMGRTLTHIMITEWAYTQRMQGLEMPPYETWPIQDENPPAFEVIETTWREQATQTRRVLEKVQEWDRENDYTSKSREGKKVLVTVSPADIFTQMTLHEVHHRAQVMAMLRELGVVVQDIDFGYLTFKRREVE